MNRLLQRLADWRLECHIRRHAALTRQAIFEGHQSLARLRMDELKAAIASRSPAQVERMERKLGLV